MIIIFAAFILQSCGSKNAEAPQYLDESQYSADALEIVKLFNLRIKYVYEQNTEEYLKLFMPNSPISGLPKYKLLTIKPLSDISISEHKRYFMAVVPTEDIFMEKEKVNNQYVFIKWKGIEENWMIADID